MPDTEQTAAFYDDLSRGGVKRGLWGLESRFDAQKIIDSPSVDRHFRQVVAPFLTSDRRVLDIGCGPGGFTAVLAESGGEVVGLDVSEEWVRAAQRTFEDRGLTRASAVLGSGIALPFDDESFDAVTLIDVLHHLDDPDATLREARRVLKPGGRLLVFEPNKLNPALTLLCLLDRNEWGFLRPAMGTHRGYRRMVGPVLRVDEVRYSGLLIGPDGRFARRIADTVVKGRGLGWLSPKIFVAATRTA